MNTVSKTNIQSNVVNRLKKIRSGVVYDDMRTFLFELIQNTQRANATRVEITISKDKIMIKDNGKGCKNPDNLFTLDVSGFGVGFGEGFTSIYTIADIFRVKTLNWKAEVNVEKLLRTSDVNVDIVIDSHFEGFIVEIEGEKVQENYEDLIRHAKNICSIIPDIDFYVNEEKIYKESIFTVPYGAKYYDKFNNRFYEGMLSLKPHGSYGCIKVYYEYRFVMDLYSINGVEGAVLIKPNKVNLKAPDRKSIIYDDKRRDLIEHIEKDAKTLCKNVLKNGDSEDIDEFSNTIETYIDVSEYVRYLTIDESKILNQYDTRKTKEELVEEHDVKTTALELPNGENETVESDSPEFGFDDNFYGDTHQVSDSNATHNNVNAIVEGLASVSFATQQSTNKDTERKQDDREFSSFVRDSPLERVSKNDMKKVSLNNIKKKSNVVWVETANVNHKKELISKFEYYGVFTFISPHVLYDKALRFLGISHIDDVEENAIEKNYKVKNTGAKTKKEQRVMELLHFIEKGLNTKQTFFISDIDCKMIVNLNEAKIYQEKLNVEGYCQGDVIHLNRKAMEFGKINSTMLGNKTIGIHDVKFILANIELLAHELAHLLYNTEDNTILHHETTFQIQEKIGDLFMKNDTIA